MLLLHGTRVDPTPVLAIDDPLAGVIDFLRWWLVPLLLASGC